MRHVRITLTSEVKRSIVQRDPAKPTLENRRFSLEESGAIPSVRNRDELGDVIQLLADDRKRECKVVCMYAVNSPATGWDGLWGETLFRQLRLVAGQPLDHVPQQVVSRLDALVDGGFVNIVAGVVNCVSLDAERIKQKRLIAVQTD